MGISATCCVTPRIIWNRLADHPASSRRARLGPEAPTDASPPPCAGSSIKAETSLATSAGYQPDGTMSIVRRAQAGRRPEGRGIRSLIPAENRQFGSRPLAGIDAVWQMLPNGHAFSNTNLAYHSLRQGSYEPRGWAHETAIVATPEFLNAVPARLAGPFPLHCARSHPRPLLTDLRTAARGLGSQCHQDRRPDGRRRRRAPRGAAPWLGFPEPASQQTRDRA